MTTLLEVDGAIGEGGGQVLRSALSLSLLTGQPFRLSRIRANRDRGGLRPQHLAAVQAAARISGAKVSGDRVGSEEIEFAPGPVRPGDYFFDIGTAGATSHLVTNAEVVRLFLPIEISLDGPLGSPATVRLRPAPTDVSGPIRETEDACSAKS